MTKIDPSIIGQNSEEASSVKRVELREIKKDERFTSFMGIQSEKMATTKNALTNNLTIKTEKLKTERKTLQPKNKR